VDVVTGPNQGNVTGFCGHSCEGTAADTDGVLEFDTVSGTIVGSWQPSDALGADPVVSSYGDAIALFGNNGGSSIRILKPGKNGYLSEVWADLEVGFGTGEASREKAVSDSVFIQDSTHNIAVFSSTLSNEIVLVDLSKDTPTMNKILLTDGEEVNSNHGRGARRNVVWAVGTDYVWVDAEKEEAFYIIKLSPDGDVSKAKLDKVITGVPTRRLVYVENYRAEFNHEKVAMQIEAASSYAKDKTVDPVGIIGLVLGAMAFFVSVQNMVVTRRLQSTMGKETQDTISLPSQI